jgi:cell division protein ZapA
MADVRLSIGGHEYIVTCQDGEEAHLLALGEMVDAKAREAGGSMGGLNESRQLLFASLILADNLNDCLAKTVASPAPQNDGAPLNMDQAAQTLENLAIRIEKLADRLET